MNLNRSSIKLGALIVLALALWAVVIKIVDFDVLSLIQDESDSKVLKIYSPLNERIILPIVK